VTSPILRLFSSRTFVWIAAAAIFCLAFVVLPSFPKVRTILSAPLVVHDPNARGDACYVLAGGGSIWERLDAAADLVQMGRASRIFLMQDNGSSQYSFKANRSWTRTKWSSDYLAWRGISADRISWIAQTEGVFGTLTEARVVAENLPKDVKTLVVVSSAPHMRRAMLAFRRSLSADVHVVPYAATEFENSYEMHHPIWIEYLKLLVYFAVS
jgi:uncharacterized SAM-binding protein YcdF (DUF218 family)